MAQAQSLADKVRNLTPAELHAREREQSEQLFKLKFQMKMGQTESVKKLRELKKEIARIKTVAREKELGIGHVVAASPAGESEAAPKKAAAKKKTASKKSAKKKTAKKAAPRKTAKKKSAGKKKTEKK